MSRFAEDLAFQILNARSQDPRTISGIIDQALLERSKANIHPRAGAALQFIISELDKLPNKVTAWYLCKYCPHTISKKEIYNALGYLARRGTLKKIGYGEYEKEKRQ